MRSEYQHHVECSGALARTAAQPVLGKDLQPEWSHYDERPMPIDAPTFMPLGSSIQYDGKPLGNFGLIDRRIV